MTRRSSTVENVVRQCSRHFEALDLENFDSHCDSLKSHNRADYDRRQCEELDLENFDTYCDIRARYNRADSYTELESDINDKVVELNRSGNERFAFINGYKDYKRNLRAFHRRRSLDQSDLHNKFKKNLEKHMKLSSFINHQRNILSFYLTHVNKQCELLCNSPYAKPIVEFESLLMKCLTVCRIILPVSEMSSCDEDFEQYQNIASILRFCHQINLTDSHIVAQLLKIILGMHLGNSNDAGRVQHVNYDIGFLQYLIHHVEIESINLDSLLSENSNTVWSFFNQFSILNAMVDGDKGRMVSLLSSGVQIFPQYEQEKSGHKFPDISQTLDRPQLLILEIMNRIVRNSIFHLGESVTEEQRLCFDVVWKNAPGTLFPTKNFLQALEDEHDHLLSCGIARKDCDERKRETTRFLKMYTKKFL